MPVISLCFSPGIQRSVILKALVLGEVNRLQSVAVDVSGKGINVARVLQRLGVETICLAQGGDNLHELAFLAQQEGLKVQFIASSGALRTCTTIIEQPAQGARVVTELVEPTFAVDAACVAAMSEAVQARLPTAQALVIAGSMAPGFPTDYQAQLALAAQKSGVPVLLDLHGAALRAALVAQPEVVKINLAEFASTLLGEEFQGGEHHGILATPEPSAALVEGILAVTRRFSATFVLTRGAKSVLLAQGDQLRNIPIAPLAPAAVLNPIGSGDSFLAGMLAHLLRSGPFASGEPIHLDRFTQAVKLATACAQSNARTLRPGFLEDSFAA